MYKYPDIEPLKDGSLLYNRNVYFIEPYDPGISLSVKMVDGAVNIVPLNWDGTPKLDMDDFLTKSLESNEIILENFRLSGIYDYQLFFDSGLKIVDLAVNDEFVSPGMLTSLLGKNFQLQNILAHGVLNSASLNKMINDYKHFIIKPMIRFCFDNEKSKPYYARIL